MTQDNLESCLTVLFSGNQAQAKRAAQLLKKNCTERVLNFLCSPRLPEKATWDLEIQSILNALASIDLNNIRNLKSVGEREGRVYSPLVSARHMHFAHGIGRSGDLLEIQPKALGSSIVQRITNKLTREALLTCGLSRHAAKVALVVPSATGMAITLTLRALQRRNPNKTKVLWIRIDQKSAIKAIALAGLEIVVVENIIESDEVRTDLTKLEQLIIDHDPSTILCVLSTSSCFAPRCPDRLVEIGSLCKQYSIGHIVNNAYGIHSNKATHLLNEVVRTGGRLDAFIQSTDKNFLVPVGGSIVAGPDPAFIAEIGQIYPGRASISPILDLFITLLSMGTEGLVDLRKKRIFCFSYFKECLVRKNLPHLKLLNTPHNDISMAVAYSGPLDDLGSRLYYRGISGARMVTPGKKTLSLPTGYTLASFGAHHGSYPVTYLNVASAIGQEPKEIDDFIDILSSVIGCSEK